MPKRQEKKNSNDILQKRKKKSNTPDNGWEIT